LLSRELNKSLIENQQQWKERVRLAEEKVKRVESDTKTRVDDLESQVCLKQNHVTASIIMQLCTIDSGFDVLFRYTE